MATDSIKCSLHAHEDETEPFLREGKLAPSSEPRHNECKISRLRSSRATLLKMFGPLIRFHAMNVLVAIEAVVLIALVLATVAFSQFWLVAIAYWILLVAVFERISSIPQEGLKMVAWTSLVVLWGLSLTNTYTLYMITAIPCSVMAATSAFVILYSISELMSLALVKTDTQLVQFIDSASPSDSVPEASRLDPEECADRFELQRPCLSIGELKMDAATCRVWAMIFYCAVIKVIAGAMSTVVLVLAVIQPVVGVSTLGYDLFLGRETIAVNLIPIVLLWMIGVLGSKWRRKYP